MMRIPMDRSSLCLVNPPLTGSVRECHLPVGLLSLAAAIRAAGFSASVLDLHVAWRRGELPSATLIEAAADRILQQEPRIIGFTTMCTSYLTSALVAKRCKAINDELVVIFGGPQASAVDHETLDLLPWVDLVVRGEGEDTLPDLLLALSEGMALDQVAGITYRAPDGRIARTPQRGARQDLGSLSVPAYDALPSLEPYRGSMAVEGGRGCPFACTYCCVRSAFDKSYRQYRVPPPNKIAHEMEILRAMTGVATFSILHPLFTCDRRFVDAFCKELEQHDTHLRWSCCARTNSVPPELLSEMARAGCGGMFFGAESGSDETLKLVRKKVDASRTLPAVRACLSAGIQPTVSLMIGFREERADQLNLTLELALACAHQGRVNVDLHLVSLLPQTEMWHTHKDKLVLTDFALCCGDMGLGRTPTSEERDLVEKNPETFSSFYSLLPEHLDLHLLHAIRTGFSFVVVFRARTFLLIMERAQRSALASFEELLAHCAGRFDFEAPFLAAHADDWDATFYGFPGPESDHWGSRTQRPPMQEFDDLYVEWARTICPGDRILDELLRFEQDLIDLRGVRQGDSPHAGWVDVAGDTVVQLSASTHLLRYEFDVTNTLDAHGTFRIPLQEEVVIAADIRSGVLTKCTPLALALIAGTIDPIPAQRLWQRTLEHFDTLPDEALTQVRQATQLLVGSGLLEATAAR